MKKLNLFNLTAGCILLYISSNLSSFGNLILILLPLFIGVLYLLSEIGLIHTTKYVDVIFEYSFVPIIFILLLYFDEYLTSLPNYIYMEIRGGWYDGSGVCTEATFCYIWGVYLVGIISFISIVIGMIKLSKISSV